MQRKTWRWIAFAAVLVGVIVVVARERSPQRSLGPQGVSDLQGQQSAQRPPGRPSGGAPAPGVAPAQGGAPAPGAAPGPRGRRQAGPAPLVTAGRLQATEISTTLSLTATVISLQETRVQSKVSGYLESVAVRPGDSIRAGQVVAVVEHSQLDAQVRQAQQAAVAAVSAVRSARAAAAAADAQVANAVAAQRRAEADLGNARAAVDKAKAQLNVAAATQSRMATLLQQGFVAQQAADQANADLQSAQAGVAAAEAEVRVSQASLDQAKAQLRASQAQQEAAAAQVSTQQAQAAGLAAALQNAQLTQAGATIRAPLSGIVVNRSLDPGAYVSPGATAPILTVADLDHIAVVVNVSEASMGAVRSGGTARVSVDAFPGRVFKGVVGRIAGGVDPDTRTAQVEIDVPNPGHPLRPGMYARVQLAGAPHRANVVPLTAIVMVGGQPYVWIVENGQVSRRAVTIGATAGTNVEITGGVDSTATIVFRGTDQLREGGPVRVIPPGQ
jgi:RND family efflux transporter MFP subunit